MNMKKQIAAVLLVCASVQLSAQEELALLPKDRIIQTIKNHTQNLCIEQRIKNRIARWWYEETVKNFGPYNVITTNDRQTEYIFSNKDYGNNQGGSSQSIITDRRGNSLCVLNSESKDPGISYKNFEMKNGKLHVVKEVSSKSEDNSNEIISYDITKENWFFNQKNNALVKSDEDVSDLDTNENEDKSNVKSEIIAPEIIKRLCAVYNYGFSFNEYTFVMMYPDSGQYANRFNKENFESEIHNLNDCAIYQNGDKVLLVNLKKMSSNKSFLEDDAIVMELDVKNPFILWRNKFSILMLLAVSYGVYNYLDLTQKVNDLTEEVELCESRLDMYQTSSLRKY